MKTVSMLFMVAALALAGCASLPEYILPSYVPESTYANISREDAENEQARLVDEITKSADAQRTKSGEDVKNVIFIGMTSGGADHATELANLKGHFVTLQKVAAAKWPDFKLAKMPKNAREEAPRTPNPHPIM